MPASKHPIVLTTVGSFHTDIVARLKRLGAAVVVGETVHSAIKLYHKASHVLLPGGSDIHPSNYNQPVRHANQSNDRRDSIELLIADLAIMDRKPLFGICRGHQVITVAAGGDLYQDIYKDTRINHGYGYHPVAIERGTLLSKMAGGRTSCVVNSYHHQATRRVPDGWFVAAQSKAGVIEAISHPELPVVSVQWHPEVMLDGIAMALFRNWLAL